MIQCPANATGLWARFKERRKQRFSRGMENRRDGRRARLRKYRLIISYVLRTSRVLYSRSTQVYARLGTDAPRRKDYARTRRK